MESISRESQREPHHHIHLMWAIPSAIATGFFLTSISLNLKTPQVAIESDELEKFLVDNWHDTIGNGSVVFSPEPENDWLLPTDNQPPQTLSLSSP